MPQAPIRIQLSVEQAEALFRRVIQTAPSPAQAIAGLNAMELVLGCHTDSGDRPGESYRAIRESLGRHLEQQRDRLLQQQARQLALALNREAFDAVTHLHASLSREAFHRVVERYCASAEAASLAPIVERVELWCRNAEARARRASPYPDAFDWQAAGIDLNQYLAMQDLQRALTASRSTGLYLSL